MEFLSPKGPIGLKVLMQRPGVLHGPSQLEMGVSSSPTPNNSALIPLSRIGTYDAPPEGQPVAAPNSRWADIRAANNTAKTSTWDRIRDQRAKADNPPSSPPSSTTQSTPGNPFFNGIPVPPTPTPRQPTPSAPVKKLGTGFEGKLESGGEVLDKEAFDALLEAERNFGQDQEKKPQSRWS